MKSNPHLNSLGFVIGGKQARAYIAWGTAPDGSRIEIEEAERGGMQGLRCECGALLVAKKGDVRTHHFAHRAGDVRFCSAASAAAASNFISDTLLDAQKVSLPVTGGRFRHAQVLAVAKETLEGHPVHLVDAQKGRRLVVAVRLRRQDTSALKDWCKRHDTSGMVIDLTAYRSQPDDEIKIAILGHALRQWLYRSQRQDASAPLAVRRRLYGL